MHIVMLSRAWLTGVFEQAVNYYLLISISCQWHAFIYAFPHVALMV